MSHCTTVIPKFRFSEPRINLPTLKSGVASSEDRFTIAFARAYQQQSHMLHARSTKTAMALVREIPVNGYGITDLLAVAWTSMPGEMFPTGEAFACVAKPTCRAFEMKLSHWQKALRQASRYRNFAHQPIVVLPPIACGNALRALDTFKRVQVGLWSFEPKTNRIIPYFTPEPHRPRSLKYWYQSLDKAAKAARSILPIRGTTESLLS